MACSSFCRCKSLVWIFPRLHAKSDHASGTGGKGVDAVYSDMQLLGRRAAVVNLDPANDALPYECAVDVRDLISLEEVQEQEGLGPNGGAPSTAVRQWLDEGVPLPFSHLTVAT